MSTRCNIICKIKRAGEDAQQFAVLYHHCDGYPDGVGYNLIERLEEASGIQRWHAGSFVTELVKDPYGDYEITTGLHLDVEYVYTILFEYVDGKPRVTLSYHEVEDFGNPEVGKEITMKIFE